MTFKEWKVTLVGIHKALDSIISLVGEDFLEGSVRPVKERKNSVTHERKKYGHLVSPLPHPLVSLWKKGYHNYQELLGKKTCVLSKELLELYDIGMNLTEIRDICVVDNRGIQTGFDMQHLHNRFTSLEEFEKVVYEIKVASSLKRAGYKVCFVKESEEKRPDLLVEKSGQRISIECK